MSKIFTIEQLNDSLDSALAWRRHELHLILTEIEKRMNHPARRSGLIRGGITLLYAHWEGFIRESAMNYLEFISNKRLPYSRLTPNFTSMAIKQLLTQASESRKTSVHIEVVYWMMNNLGEPCHIAPANVVKTDSNLSSRILDEICLLLGVSFNDHETKRVLIDKQLLESRNSIAHGKQLMIDFEAYRSIYDNILDLLDRFRVAVLNAAASNAFLANLD